MVGRSGFFLEAWEELEDARDARVAANWGGGDLKRARLTGGSPYERAV